ncbi:MAG: hypothetical protein ABIB71_07030 [Candidatus Woesearchaeota archaeon]
MSETEVEEEKKKLRKVKRIIFNEPHFTTQMILREGSKREVISNIKNPKNLVGIEKSITNRDRISLYFKICDTRTMKIPAKFKRRGKALYIFTYIMRHRQWRTTK